MGFSLVCVFFSLTEDVLVASRMDADPVPSSHAGLGFGARGPYVRLDLGRKLSSPSGAWNRDAGSRFKSSSLR